MIFKDLRRGEKKSVYIANNPPGKEKIIKTSPLRTAMRDVEKKRHSTVHLGREKVQKKISVAALRRSLDQKDTKTGTGCSSSSPSIPFSFLAPLPVFLIMGGMLFLLLFFMFPLLQGDALIGHTSGVARDGFYQLYQALERMQEGDLQEAGRGLEQTRRDFNVIQVNLNELSNFNRFMEEEGSDISLFVQLLNAGELFLEAGEQYLSALDGLQNTIQQVQQKSEQPFGSITDRLRQYLDQWSSATEQMKKGYDILVSIPLSGLPSSLRDVLSTLQQKITVALRFAQTVKEQGPLVLDFLGAQYPRTYLVLLQNRDEMRPTGGFIGSLVFVTFNNGWITNISFKDVYDFDGQMKEQISAPEGLTPITKYWYLRDSNYAPDFFVAGQDVVSFLNKEGGPTVDGVFAINQGLIEDLLALIGPIRVEGVSIPFTKDNFSLLLSSIVEAKLNKTYPKEILGRLIPALIAKIAQADPVAVTDILSARIEGRDVVFYSPWEQLERMASDLSLDGRFATLGEKTDYMLIANTSVSGNKSDRYIRQQVTHETFISQTGRIVNRLTLERSHLFTSKENQRMEEILKQAGVQPLDEPMKQLLGKGKNVSFVRVYVPEGSVLLDSIGIPLESVKVQQELGRTVFAFPMEVYPGTSRSIIISYEMPFHLDLSSLDSYKILFEKQIGDQPFSLHKTIYLDAGLSFRSLFPVEARRGFLFDIVDTLESRTYFSVLIEKGK